MWRFILVSFVFLAWAFYEMSGGADYRPVANSIQARALLDDQRPRARAVQDNGIGFAQGTLRPGANSRSEVASRAAPGTALAATASITLVSATASPNPVPTVALRPTGAATPALDVPISDLRRVAGGSVNLRTGPGTQFGRLIQLQRGTEVEVLRDPGAGWVKLRVVETGRIGWMAERLLMAAN